MPARLKCSLVAACWATPSAAALVGLLLALGLAVQEGSLQSLPDTLGVGFLVAGVGCLLAIVPALAYGAPLHFFLVRRGWANPVSVSCLAVVPAVLAAVVDPDLPIWILAFGVPIALFTHRFSQNCREAEAKTVAVEGAPGGKAV